MTSHKQRGSAFVEVSLLLTVFFFGTKRSRVRRKFRRSKASMS